jgi:hypothetical protein
MQANQTYIRVQNAMQGAQYVGYPGASGTGSEIFFWQNDNVHNYLTAQGYNGPYVSDPYVGEMALIQYDATTQTLWLYYVPESAATTAYSQQPTPLTLADINESSEATWFSQQPFVTKQALGGPGTQPNDGTRLLVSSFQVYVSSLGSSTELPVIEYSIGFTRSDGTSLTLYNSTTVRSPTTQPE